MLMGAKHLTNIDGRDIILYEKRMKRKQGGIEMEILLAVLLTVGVSYLLFGVFQWVEKGLRYAMPWWIAWFLFHAIVLEALRLIGGF